MNANNQDLKKNAMAVVLSLGLSAVSATAFSASNELNDYPKVPNDFSALDKNSDEMITPDEANSTNLSNYFISIDMNVDNSISEQEFDAFVARYPSLVEGGYSDTEEAE